MSFDKRVFKLTTLTVEEFGRLGRNGEDLLEQEATSMVGRKDGGKTRKGMLTERIKQVILVTAQVAIS